MENECKKTDYLKEVPIVISIMVVLNYYMSYIWLSKLLSYFNLEMAGVIVLDDILFKFGRHNILILTVGLVGYLTIFLLRIPLSETTYNSLGTEGKNSLKTIKNAFGLVKRTWVKILIVVMVVTIIGFTLCYIFCFNREIPPSMLEVIFIVLVFVLPGLFLFIAKKRKEIAILSFILMIAFFHMMVDEIIKEAVNNIKERNIELSFIYDDMFISTTNDKVLVYEGYKYIVLYNFREKETFRYEVSRITHLRKKMPGN